MRTRTEDLTETHSVVLYQCQSASCPNGQAGAPAEVRAPATTGVTLELWDPEHALMWFDVPSCVTTWSSAELPKLFNPVPAPPPNPTPVGP